MNYSNVDNRLKTRSLSRSLLRRLKRIRESSIKARSVSEKKAMVGIAVRS